jgi:hypothetical protein
MIYEHVNCVLALVVREKLCVITLDRNFVVFSNKLSFPLVFKNMYLINFTELKDYQKKIN